MPKTLVRHAPRATRSDPLQRTRSAVHLDLPPYTPQTRFFHYNLGEPNDVPATHDEIIVLSKTVEVARRILGSIRSEETTIDALMDVGGLALDETLGETPPVKEAPERDWIAKQVGDWLRGSNMVIYIDDDIEDSGMCVPLNAQEDLYISHNELVSTAVCARTTVDHMAYRRSILHLAITVCHEAQHLVRGRVVGIVHDTPSTVTTTDKKHFRPVYIENVVKYAGEGGRAWEQDVVGGELVAILGEGEDDDQQARCIQQLVLQSWNPNRYFKIKDEVVTSLVEGK